MGCVSHQTDPYVALFRDSEEVNDGILSRCNSIKTPYETHLVQLTVQQKKQVETMKIALQTMEKRCLSVKKNRLAVHHTIFRLIF